MNTYIPVTVTKVHVGSRTRKLNAGYTIEMTDEIQHALGPGVEEELSRLLQEQIDREILEKVATDDLVKDGWTQIAIKEWRDNPTDWLEKNAQDEYRMFNRSICFKNHYDAMLYSMRFPA